MPKNKGQYGFFDIENQLDKIYELDDFLPKLNALINWEMFRPILSKVREKEEGKENPNNVGRPPFDVVLMFKILVLKSTYNLADEKRRQIADGRRFFCKLPSAVCRLLAMIHEKGYRNKPLTEQQKELNKGKSNVRCRVEHVFGAMKSRCRDEVLRSIGIGRAKFWIGMRNLPVSIQQGNFGRFVSLNCPKKFPKAVKVR
jgi:hypothetical protein